MNIFYLSIKNIQNNLHSYRVSLIYLLCFLYKRKGVAVGLARDLAEVVLSPHASEAKLHCRLWFM